MNDLQVKVSQQPGKIVCNFKEIKEALEVQMTAYTTLEITEEGQKEAKADLATLRKIRKSVDDQRKTVKKEYMAAYDEFEAEVKGLLAVIDEPITMIDSKLKEFDEKRIAEKQEHLHQLYEEGIGEYAEYLPYHMLASPRWNNATCKDSEIKYEISEAVLKVKTDIETIRMLGSEIEDQLLATYKNAGNSLPAAIKANSDYNQAKKLAEEKLAEEKLKEEKTQGTRLDDSAAIPGDIPFSYPDDLLDIPATLSSPYKDKTDGVNVVAFLIKGAENIQTVRDILFLNGIDYEER